MPWRMPLANVVKVASPQQKRSSIVTASCTMSSALCVPSAFSSFQTDFSMRYGKPTSGLVWLILMFCTWTVIWHCPNIYVSMSSVQITNKILFSLLCRCSLKAESTASMIFKCFLPPAVTSVVSIFILRVFSNAFATHLNYWLMDSF